MDWLFMMCFIVFNLFYKNFFLATMSLNMYAFDDLVLNVNLLY